MAASQELPDSYQPSAEEIAQMCFATPEEARAVDAMVLRQCSRRWRKVAMVVAQLLDEFERQFPYLPFAYIQARMQKLEDSGVLEIGGDVWAMRHSEVRLIEAQNEA